MAKDMADSSSPIRPERLMDAINQVRTDDAIFSIDVGTSTVWSTRYLSPAIPTTWRFG
jgi:pyruvate oxidase